MFHSFGHNQESKIRDNSNGDIENNRQSIKVRNKLLFGDE